MDEETRFISKMYIGFALLVVVLGIIGLCMMPIRTYVERLTLENSIQYQSAKKDQNNMLEAALEEIDAKLSVTSDSEIRKQLEAQRTTISAQLRAARN